MINRKLATILREQGFNEPCNFMYYLYETGNNKIYSSDNFNHNYPALNVPTNEQIINWIFNSESKNETFKTSAEWFHFWYNHLVENEFELIGEFIYKLKKWFNKINIEFDVFFYKSNEPPFNYIYDFFPDFNKTNFIHSLIDFDLAFKTRNEAEHNGILKVFEMLNNTISSEYTIFKSFKHGTGKLLVTKDLVEIEKGDHYLTEGFMVDFNIFTWLDEFKRPFKAIKIIGKSKDFEWNLLTQGFINSIPIVEI